MRHFGHRPSLAEQDAGDRPMKPTVAEDHTFPHYTAAEAAVDRALHLVAVTAAIGGSGWLLLATISTASIKQTVALAIYSCGLIAMLIASAAYNLCRPSHRKELMRRVDHAMIFVMIAGTYTPFTLFALKDGGALLFYTLIWSVAIVGITLKLAFPRRCERPLLALYLIMGWMILGAGRSFAANLSAPVLFLLFVGGAAYSLGAFIHAQGRLPFHNVVWHALVVVGASLHWAAVVHLFVPPASVIAQ
jgi:hemolysin III